MTTFALRNASPAKTKADVVIVGVLTGSKGRPALPAGAEIESAYGRKFAGLLSTLSITGKAGEVVKVPTNSTIGAPVLVFVGMGESATALSVRRAAGAGARAATNAASVALALPADTPELVTAVTEGFLLGSYEFTAYKKGGSTSKVSEVVVLSPSARKAAFVAAFDEAQILAEAVAQARDWVNTPARDLTPAVFADAAVAAVAAAQPKGRGAKPLKITVLDEKELAELGCGGILGVGAASAAPPRLVRIDYKPAGATKHLAWIGKGITFDSGGLSIKPAASMKSMKEDMGGAAAVISAITTVARLGLPVRITAYAAMAENMLGGSAMRPGDVLTMRNGKTVEVMNTDAEGRLVMADALSLAAELKPDVILDVATLTGHMVVALGDKIAGVMGDEAIVAQVLAAGEAAGEALWPMPIPEKMKERIDASRVADVLQHDWVRWGGGLMAAAFLREFTDGLPWGHLDIAGPAFNTGGPAGHWSSGGTGFGVTTLVEFARAASA